MPQLTKDGRKWLGVKILNYLNSNNKAVSLTSIEDWLYKYRESDIRSKIDELVNLGLLEYCYNKKKVKRAELKVEDIC